MGDSDGVCVIPREHIELVLSCAEEKLAYEDKRNETIAQYREAKKKGEPLPQLAPQWYWICWKGNRSLPIHTAVLKSEAGF